MVSGFFTRPGAIKDRGEFFFCKRILNLIPAICDSGKAPERTTMADRSSLKLVGFIFATITLAVMLATAMVVKGYAAGGYTLESTSFVRQSSHTLLTTSAPLRD